MPHYSCETWSSASLRKAETLCRKAIKITFGLRSNTPNEIIFFESGLIELKSEIYKRQYNFWVKTLETINNDPYSEISKAITKSIAKNVHYVRHYKKLVNDFRNAQECFNFHTQCFENKLMQDIADKTRVHWYSALDDYILINPLFETPKFNTQYTLGEMERQIIVKYRSGSHMLKINTGYFQRTPIEARKCKLWNTSYCIVP